MSYPKKTPNVISVGYTVYRKGDLNSQRFVLAPNAPKARMEYLRLEREAGRNVLYTQVTVQRSRV